MATNSLRGDTGPPRLDEDQVRISGFLSFQPAQCLFFPVRFRIESGDFRGGEKFRRRTPREVLDDVG
jgi:hypothetical protein